jgi:SAM-dependent methyltransferase
MLEYQDAAAYERLIAPKFRAIAEQLVQIYGPRRDERVLEVGAGTGLLTRLLTASAKQVTAVDRSLPMMRKLHSLLPPRSSDSVLRTCVADLSRLPFGDGSFDAILANLTPLQGSSTAVREAVRVLRPAGRVALSMWGPSYSEIRLINRALRAIGQPHAPYGTLRQVLARFGRLGFRTEHRIETFAVEHENVAAYLDYRRAFGRPPEWSEVVYERYNAAFAEIVRNRPWNGRVRLDWNVVFLQAIRA